MTLLQTILKLTQEEIEIKFSNDSLGGLIITIWNHKAKSTFTSSKLKYDSLESDIVECINQAVEQIKRL